MNTGFQASHSRVAHSACLAGRFFAAGALQVTAGRDLTVDTAQNSNAETHFKSVKRSGFSGGLMSGVSYQPKGS